MGSYQDGMVTLNEGDNACGSGSIRAAHGGGDKVVRPHTPVEDMHGRLANLCDRISNVASMLSGDIDLLIGEVPTSKNGEAVAPASSNVRHVSGGLGEVRSMVNNAHYNFDRLEEIARRLNGLA